jgi:outer membrane protein OmpA-like peptidoglycan-associated protein
MAELDVEPKRRSTIIHWLLLGLGLIAVLFFLTRQPNKVESKSAATTTSTATSTSSHAAMSKKYWNAVDFNAPAANYNEITSRNINVRGTKSYAIYSLDEETLFNYGKSTLRADVFKDLLQIANSIEQRYTHGQVRIYGYTDVTGSAKADKQLAQQRVETVRNWLSQNGNIATDHITIHPVNEARPASLNQASESHQQNHYVDIVALRSL